MLLRQGIKSDAVHVAGFEAFVLKGKLEARDSAGFRCESVGSCYRTMMRPDH